MSDLSPSEALQHYRAGLSGLKRSSAFVPNRESWKVVDRLQELLALVEESGCDAKTGVDLVARFLECDDATLGRCDDSSGLIGNVFRGPATELFAEFAAACADKDWLVQRIVDLLDADEYGVRGGMLEFAPEFLDEDRVRELIERFMETGRNEPKRPSGFSLGYTLAGELAEALGDAVLYEKCMTQEGTREVGGLAARIATVYLNEQMPTAAMPWIDRLAKMRNSVEEAEQLRVRALSMLGAKNQAGQLAREVFEREPSVEKLERVVELVGPECREELIDGTEARVLEGAWDLFGVDFLLRVGRFDAAEQHVIEQRDELGKEPYRNLLILLERMEREGHLLGAVCLYRGLVDATLKKSIAKYYGHAVRYLRQLEMMAPRIDDWRDVDPHDVYWARMIAKHRQKSALMRRLGVGEGEG